MTTITLIDVECEWCGDDIQFQSPLSIGNKSTCDQCEQDFEIESLSPVRLKTVPLNKRFYFAIKKWPSENAYSVATVHADTFDKDGYWEDSFCVHQCFGEGTEGYDFFRGEMECIVSFPDSKSVQKAKDLLIAAGGIEKTKEELNFVNDCFEQ